MVCKFSVRLKIKKEKEKVLVLRIFIVRVIQSTSGTYKCCSKSLIFEDVYLPPLRLQGLIDFD